MSSAVRSAKSTSPSLQSLTVDSAARFSKNFGTRASSHRDGEVWIKYFDFKSFCALEIISFLDSVSTQLANRSIFSFRITACVFS